MENLYQSYLLIIEKLKDVYKLDFDVDHKDIHTFYKDKRPLFKLLFGLQSKDGKENIVISFHIELLHHEVVSWFINIFEIFPDIKIYDSYLEDSSGETYLGEDAMALQEVFKTQKILAEWLEKYDREEIEQFAKSPVVGRRKHPNKSFESTVEKQKALDEFSKIKKPSDSGDLQ